MCGFLQRHGLHDRGLWRRECACSRHLPWGSLAPEAAPPDAEIFGDSFQPNSSEPGPPVSLSSASWIAWPLAQMLRHLRPAMHLQMQMGVCQSWSDFYARRRLPSSWPAGALLPSTATFALLAVSENLYFSSFITEYNHSMMLQRCCWMGR